MYQHRSINRMNSSQYAKRTSRRGLRLNGRDSRNRKGSANWKHTSSNATFLAKSQNNLYAQEQIASTALISAGALAAQMSHTATQKRYAEQVALQVKLNPVHSNFNPSKGLDPVIYFGDGSSVDTSTNIFTKSNGQQVDATTGLEYRDPKTTVSLANGAYLDTQNNILHMSDGTKVDTISGVKITV